MKHTKTKFSSSPPVIYPDQIEWLHLCTRGKWGFSPKTGLIDVDGNFDCSRQGLVDFKGVRFGVVTGYFNADNNNITSLDGSPREIWSHLYFSNNLLTSLEGGPVEVCGHLCCSNNLLTSLEGAPRWGGTKAWFSSNPVSERTLMNIFSHMKGKKGYERALKYEWRKIPLEDQVLLYRPEFRWIVGEERRKLEALIAYLNIKHMI